MAKDPAVEEFIRVALKMQIMLSKDGNQWCALIGRDLMAGVAGFGKTKRDALCALAEEIEVIEKG